MGESNSLSDFICIFAASYIFEQSKVNEEESDKTKQDMEMGRMQDSQNIRLVTLADAEAITEIYNHYIKETTITFEVEPITVEEMASRIKEISAHFPCFVYEEEGRVLGYCYAHLWKERAAYSKTLETTVYLNKDATLRGIGSLMVKHLIGLCREQGYHALIACITEGNVASVRMHESLGFKHVSEFKEVGQKFGQWLGVVDMELIL